MEGSVEKAKKLLAQYKQEHIINVIDKLDLSQQQELVKQILSIDFENLKELYETALSPVKMDLSVLEPVVAVNPDRLEKNVIDNYLKLGEAEVRKGKFAVSTMAGGERKQTAAQISQREC